LPDVPVSSEDRPFKAESFPVSDLAQFMEGVNEGREFLRKLQARGQSIVKPHGPHRKQGITDLAFCKIMFLAVDGVQGVII
jgi:hypothetical protein